MSLRKYGTGDGEILPESDDMQKQASTPQEREQVLAEVKAEADDADEEN